MNREETQLLLQFATLIRENGEKGKINRTRGQLSTAQTTTGTLRSNRQFCQGEKKAKNR